jgi:hypothetical protein
MSFLRLLGKLLLFATLEIGVLSGVKISQEEIEKLMNAMHRVQVVRVVKKERDGDPK